MNKNLKGSALLALLIAGTTTFTVLADVPNLTAVIGDKAYNLNYINAHSEELEPIIQRHITEGKPILVKGMKAQWVKNATGEPVESVMEEVPEVTYYSESENGTVHTAGDDAVITAESFAAEATNKLVVTMKYKIEKFVKEDFSIEDSEGRKIQVKEATHENVGNKGVMTFTLGEDLSTSGKTIYNKDIKVVIVEKPQSKGINNVIIQNQAIESISDKIAPRVELKESKADIRFETVKNIQDNIVSGDKATVEINFSEDLKSEGLSKDMFSVHSYDVNEVSLKEGDASIVKLAITAKKDGASKNPVVTQNENIFDVSGNAFKSEENWVAQNEALEIFESENIKINGTDINVKGKFDKKEKIFISVRNLQGDVVFFNEFNSEKDGSFSYDFSFAGEDSGKYTVKLTGAEQIITERFTYNSEEKVIKEVSAIEDLKIDVTEDFNEKIPQEVTVTYEDNSTGKAKVLWYLENSSDDIKVVGSYNLIGEVEGSKITAKLKVNIVNEDKLSEIILENTKYEMRIGDELKLPKEVDVKYESGRTGKLPINWDITNVDQAKVGMYTVRGTVVGDVENVTKTVDISIEVKPTLEITAEVKKYVDSITKNIESLDLSSEEVLSDIESMIKTANNRLKNTLDSEEKSTIIDNLAQCKRDIVKAMEFQIEIDEVIVVKTEEWKKIIADGGDDYEIRRELEGLVSDMVNSLEDFNTKTAKSFRTTLGKLNVIVQGYDISQINDMPTVEKNKPTDIQATVIAKFTDFTEKKCELIGVEEKEGSGIFKQTITLSKKGWYKAKVRYTTLEGETKEVISNMHYYVK
ncbi:MAG: Ig-like domain-containing protein [Clostridium sp.]